MSAKEIATAIAAEHNLLWSDLAGPCRTNRVYRARRAAIWSIRQVKRADGKPRYSLSFLGRLFNRHHTSIMWAYRAHDKTMRHEGRLAAEPRP